MRGFTNEPGQPATKAAVQAGDQTDSEVDPWFSDMAKALLGKDAGAQLAIMAGIGPSGERSCYRYAAGTRAAKADLLRALLRGEQGEPFFEFLMEGCDAKWFRDLQRARRIASAIDQVE